MASGASNSAGPSDSTINASGNRHLEKQQLLHAGGPAMCPLSDHDILALQVQAFIDASEDVDMPPEVAEDLMSTISTQEGEAEAFGVLDGAEVSDGGVEKGENGDIDQMEMEISTLFGVGRQAEEMWTKREMKQILHHLKERGAHSFTMEYVHRRNIPICKLLLAFGIGLCPDLQKKQPATMMYFLQVAMSNQLRMRDKLHQYNTISNAVQLIRQSQRIVILTGAGISVSCGIPDFRSRNGLYASLKDQGEYDLDDPQQMFDVNYFREHPSVFYSFASQIYPSNFVPSPCHRFIKLIEDQGKLLRNYTQNIDTLETLAGVKRVLQCHGSFATASCLLCRRRVPGLEIEADILRRKVPLCTVCNAPSSSTVPAKKVLSKKKKKNEWDSDVEDESDAPEFPPGIMKPDITFFGEKLTDEFDHSLAEDRDKVDLLLVIGTSLNVSPVAEILSHLPHSIPQILINKTPIRHINPDIVLLGNADEIVEYLCAELGWDLPPPTPPSSNPNPNPTRLPLPRGNLKRQLTSDLQDSKPPERVGDSHIWLFDGAEGGRWLEEFRRRLPVTNSDTLSANTSGTTSWAASVSASPATRSGSPMDDVDVREAKKARVV